MCEILLKAIALAIPAIITLAICDIAASKTLYLQQLHRVLLIF
ncbi:MAG: hypothetical protein RMY29_022390 [Nostoc sp. CreGUA01]